MLFANKEFELFEQLRAKVQTTMDEIMQVHYKQSRDMVNNLIFVEANSIDQKHPGRFHQNSGEIATQSSEEN